MKLRWLKERPTRSGIYLFRRKTKWIKYGKGYDYAFFQTIIDSRYVYLAKVGKLTDDSLIVSFEDNDYFSLVTHPFSGEWACLFLGSEEFWMKYQSKKS